MTQTERMYLQCRRPMFDPWVGRSPREGNDYPFHYSCLGNPTDRGAWRLQSIGGSKESDTTEQLTHSLSEGFRDYNMLFTET